MRKLIAKTESGNVSTKTLNRVCRCHDCCANLNIEDWLTCREGYRHIDDNSQVMGGGIC